MPPRVFLNACGAPLCPETLPASLSICCSLAPVPSCPACPAALETVPSDVQRGRWTGRGRAWQRNPFCGHSCISEGQPSG